MDILGAAHGGQFFANAGKLAGLSEAKAKPAIAALGSQIAEALRKRAEDEAAFDDLLDLLEDGDGDAFLDDPNLIEDAEVSKDGNAVLKDLYGSKAAAIKAGEAVSGLSKAQLEKLMPVVAASVLAALVRANGGAQTLSAASSEESSGGGLFGTIVAAVVAGAMKGVQQSLKPKRRRRRYSGYSGYRRRTTRKRRTRRPSLESIFRNILTGR
jgi:hypothetical protein